MIKTSLKWLFYVVGTFYSFDAATKLLTYPNDLTFIAGLVIIMLIALFWGDMLYLAVKKVLKEINEKS
jgi:hypothetical protein